MNVLDLFHTKAGYFAFSNDGYVRVFISFGDAVNFAYDACNELQIDVSVFCSYTRQIMTYTFDFKTKHPVLSE